MLVTSARRFALMLHGVLLCGAGAADQFDDPRARDADHPAPPSAVPHDNTGRNEVDRCGRTLTPIDQSNETSAIAITAAIRRAVVRRADLSTNARNVKIITRGGTVTLRGPVASAAERAYVDAVAHATTGVKRVANELTIASH